MKHQRGLSLLELLVAFVIMAMSLGLLYQASSSGARNTAKAVQFERALILADSILGSKDSVDEIGWNESGQFEDLRWQVSSFAYQFENKEKQLDEVPLHQIEFQVSWNSGSGMQNLHFKTLRPQRKKSDINPQK